MKEHSFNTLILIGEPAFNPTGTKLVGLAAAGIKNTPNWYKPLRA